MLLTAEQRDAMEMFTSFARREVAPHADRWDREERLPREVVRKLAAERYLGAVIPREHGGTDMDATTFGLLNEAVGYACSSVRSVLTVHSMVAHAIVRWGSEQQKTRWLPLLASGDAVAAFALTEPGAGSDAGQVSSTASRRGADYLLDGTKLWITYGQAADLFLVFARCEGQACALLMERATEGCEVIPVCGLLGTRASMVAEVRLHGCRVSRDAVLGRPGFGLNAVATAALELGRYSVAWGCVGLAQACADASVEYAHQRQQFGKRLAEHQLIQRLIADMVTNVSAARLLCQQAGRLRDNRNPGAIAATWAAKYFASCSAFRAAADAVQIHGANGCSARYPVQRLLRDAKVMEIIEGSSQIQQVMIAEAAYRERHIRSGS